MIAKILAFFAYLFGRKAGQEAERQADIAATLEQKVKVQDAVLNAEANAPVDRADTSNVLRKGEF